MFIFSLGFLYGELCLIKEKITWRLDMGGGGRGQYEIVVVSISIKDVSRIEDKSGEKGGERG